VSASKFTPEVRGALIERTAAGVSLPDAARAIGIREATVKSWLTKGRRERSGEYAEFASAIEEARAAASSRPGPMEGGELAAVVSEMARKGSVQAAKLRWQMLTASETSEEDRADEFDELKERRRRRAG
jgi:transposase